METIILTCLQAQLLIQKVNSNKDLPSTVKNDLVWEIKQVSMEECKNDKRSKRSN